MGDGIDHGIEYLNDEDAHAALGWLEGLAADSGAYEVRLTLSQEIGDMPQRATVVMTDGNGTELRRREFVMRASHWWEVKR